MRQTASTFGFASPFRSGPAWRDHGRAIVLALVVLCSCMWSVEPAPDPIERDIAKAHDLDTASAMAAYAKADAAYQRRLASVCAEIARLLPPKQRAAFVQSQKSWESYRKDQIAFLDTIHEGLSGTMYLPMRAYAEMDITRQRVKDLERQLEKWKEAGE